VLGYAKRPYAAALLMIALLEVAFLQYPTTLTQSSSGGSPLKGERRAWADPAVAEVASKDQCQDVNPVSLRVST